MSSTEVAVVDVDSSLRFGVSVVESELLIASTCCWTFGCATDRR